MKKKKPLGTKDVIRLAAKAKAEKEAEERRVAEEKRKEELQKIFSANQAHRGKVDEAHARYQKAEALEEERNKMALARVKELEKIEAVEVTDTLLKRYRDEADLLLGLQTEDEIAAKKAKPRTWGEYGVAWGKTIGIVDEMPKLRSDLEDRLELLYREREKFRKLINKASQENKVLLQERVHEYAKLIKHIELSGVRRIKLVSGKEAIADIDDHHNGVRKLHFAERHQLTKEEIDTKQERAKKQREQLLDRKRHQQEVIERKQLVKAQAELEVRNIKEKYKPVFAAAAKAASSRIEEGAQEAQLVSVEELKVLLEARDRLLGGHLRNREWGEYLTGVTEQEVYQNQLRESLPDLKETRDDYRKLAQQSIRADQKERYTDAAYETGYLIRKINTALGIDEPIIHDVIRKQALPLMIRDATEEEKRQMIMERQLAEGFKRYKEVSLAANPADFVIKGPSTETASPILMIEDDPRNQTVSLADSEVVKHERDLSIPLLPKRRPPTIKKFVLEEEPDIDMLGSSKVVESDAVIHNFDGVSVAPQREDLFSKEVDLKERNYSELFADPGEIAAVAATDTQYIKRAKKINEREISEIHLRGKELLQDCLSSMPEEWTEKDIYKYELFLEKRMIKTIEDSLILERSKDDLKGEFIEKAQSEIQEMEAKLGKVSEKTKEEITNRHIQEYYQKAYSDIYSTINKAVNKLAKEIKEGRSSIEDKVNKAERYWFNIPGKTYDMFSSMFHKAALAIGVVEPTAAEIFEQAGKYAEQKKHKIEKEQDKLMSKNHGKGVLAELLSHSRYTQELIGNKIAAHQNFQDRLKSEHLLSDKEMLAFLRLKGDDNFSIALDGVLKDRKNPDILEKFQAELAKLRISQKEFESFIQLADQENYQAILDSYTTTNDKAKVKRVERALQDIGVREEDLPLVLAHRQNLSKFKTGVEIPGLHSPSSFVSRTLEKDIVPNHTQKRMK